MPTDVIITAPVQKSRFTLATFIDRVRGDCQLRSSNRITDADILAWVADGQDELAQETHWYRTASSINSVSGTKEYDLPTSTLSVEEVWWNPEERKLYVMQPDDLESLYITSPNWRYASTGTPTSYYIHGNSALGLHPTPNESTANAIFLIYSTLPTRPSSSSDFAFHPPGHEKTLIAYGAWKASLKDATGEGNKRMAEFRAAWVEGLNKCKRQVEALHEDDICVYGEYGSPSIRQFGIRADFEDGILIPAPS